MNAFTAKNILIALKKQLKQRNIYEAIDKSIEALALLELYEKEGFEQIEKI